MVLDIAAKEIGSIDWQPDTELEEIIQNVRTIITTLKGSVPLDRGFGVNVALTDAPMTVVKGRLTIDIIEAVEKYEPRAEVKEVTFSGDGAEGIVYPVVKVVLK